MGISRDGRHKRSATGGKRPKSHKKRKHALGRQPTNTKLGEERVRQLRVRGGNLKFRALRLNAGNFSWGSEAIAKKTNILDVIYSPSSNEFVRTKTLVKSSIVQIDATPFQKWWEKHYNVYLCGENKGKPLSESEQDSSTEEAKGKKLSNKIVIPQTNQQNSPIVDDNNSNVDQKLLEQFEKGKLYAVIKSRPGQTGRCDGYILEGEELTFYLNKMKLKG